MYSRSLSLIDNKLGQSKAKIKEIEETGMLFSSYLSHETQQNLSVMDVEGVSFNKSVDDNNIRHMISIARPRAQMGVLDLGEQHWSVKQMQTLLHWLSQVQSIHFLRLGSASVGSESWHCFQSWLLTSGVEVKHLDLGSLDMNLQRVRCLVDVLIGVDYIEKVDLAQSRWQVNDMKAFTWMLQSSSVMIDRFSLGESHLSSESVLQLLSFLTDSDRCRIFSSGLVQLGDQCLAQVLDLLQQRNQRLDSVLFNNQNFNYENTQKLKLFLAGAKLNRLALIACQWDRSSMQSPLEQKISAGIERIYFERAQFARAGLLTTLIAQGYIIDKEVTPNAVWLRRNN